MAALCKHLPPLMRASEIDGQRSATLWKRITQFAATLHRQEWRTIMC